MRMGPIEQPQKNEQPDFDWSTAKETVQSMGGKRANVAPLTRCTPTVGEIAGQVGRAVGAKIGNIIFGPKNP